MRVIFLLSSVFFTFGCGTFSIKNLEKSDAALEFAKQGFSKLDYSKLNEKLNLPKSTIKSVGQVQLYSAQTIPFFIDQNAWNYTQRVKRSDGIECYSYANVTLASSGDFEFSKSTPGKFYCFESDDKYQSVEIF